MVADAPRLHRRVAAVCDYGACFTWPKPSCSIEATIPLTTHVQKTEKPRCPLMLQHHRTSLNSMFYLLCMSQAVAGHRPKARVSSFRVLQHVHERPAWRSLALGWDVAQSREASATAHTVMDNPASNDKFTWVHRQKMIDGKLCLLHFWPARLHARLVARFPKLTLLVQELTSVFDTPGQLVFRTKQAHGRSRSVVVSNFNMSLPPRRAVEAPTGGQPCTSFLYHSPGWVSSAWLHVQHAQHGPGTGAGPLSFCLAHPFMLPSYADDTVVLPPSHRTPATAATITSSLCPLYFVLLVLPIPPLSRTGFHRDQLGASTAPFADASAVEDESHRKLHLEVPEVNTKACLAHEDCSLSGILQEQAGEKIRECTAFDLSILVWAFDVARPHQLMINVSWISKLCCSHACSCLPRTADARPWMRSATIINPCTYVDLCRRTCICRSLADMQSH